MKNLKSKLAKVEVEQLETRKEFTWWCYNPCHTHTPTCDHNGGGGTGEGGA